MKKSLSFILVVLFASAGWAQGPVEWKWSAKKIGDKLYEVRLTAKVDEPWHIYSQQTPKGGPLPTSISFTKSPLLLVDGKPKEEGDLEIHHEEVFDVDVYAYTGKVEFVQVVKLKANAKTNISGSIEYMACTNQQCLPPATIKFSVTLN
jgi:hypothetical protein